LVAFTLALAASPSRGTSGHIREYSQKACRRRMRTLKSDHQPNRNIGDDILDQYRAIKPLTAAELDI